MALADAMTLNEVDIWGFKIDRNLELESCKHCFDTVIEVKIEVLLNLKLKKK